jgi:hypothetical protein
MQVAIRSAVGPLGVLRDVDRVGDSLTDIENVGCAE